MITFEQPKRRGFAKDVNDFWNGLTGQTSEDLRTQQTNEMNLKAVQETNETNKSIADENLQYQRELQEYNKALQHQIFDREDTAYQRTKQDMLAAGLNPLSMQGVDNAGEAIAQSPLNNQYQAQTPQYQKSQTMMSPLQAIQGMSNILGTALSSIESIKTGSIQRDSLQTQTDINKINAFLSNIDKGVIYNSDSGKLDLDEDVFNKYLEQKAKEKDYNIAKMENDMRDWKHMIESGKYNSDTKYEQMITALQDWFLNGRGEASWEKIKQKYPILNLVDTYAKEFIKNFNKPYDTEVSSGNGNKRYYKNGVEVDKNGNPINKNKE